MKPVSLADITYEQGLQLLVLRKQALDEGHLERMSAGLLADSYLLRDAGCEFAEKQAEGGWADSISSAINRAKDQLTGDSAGPGWRQSLNSGIEQAKGYYGSLDDSTKRTLATGAVGAGLGTLAGVGQRASTGEGSYLANALRGGAIGGVLGGGLGLANNPATAQKLKDKIPEEIRRTAGLSKEKTPPVNMDYIADLTTRANSNSPELYAGGAAAAVGTGTAAGTAAASLRSKYDPRALAEQLQFSANTVAGETIPQASTTNPAGPAKPSTTAQAAYGKLLTGDGRNTNAAASVAGLNPRVAGGFSYPAMSVDEVLEQLMKQKGNQPSWFKQLIGSGLNKDTLQATATALGKSEDEVFKAITRKGFLTPDSGQKGLKAISRVGLPGLILAGGAAGLGGIGTMYANARNDRNEASRILDGITKKLVPQTNQP
jgi:hypothetical protein